MNIGPDALGRALTELADRADAEPVADRVPAVRRRARRTARRRTGAVAAVLAVLVVAVAGIAGSGGPSLLRGWGQGPAGAPAGPYLDIRMVRDEAKEATLTPRVSGGRIVVVDVVVEGRVPRWSGYRDGADVQENLWQLQLVGDNGDTTRTVRPTQTGFTCAPGAPLVDVEASFSLEIQYRPGMVTPVLGRHDLRFTAGACPPVGLVQQKLSVFVK